MLNVMLVDDDQDFLASLASYMRTPNITLSAYSDFRSATEALMNAPPDLLLTDLRLTPPVGEEGLRLAATARSRAEHCYIGVMTGFSTDELASRALVEGADTVMSKPLDFAALDSLLARLVVRQPHDGRRLDDGTANQLLDAWRRQADSGAIARLHAAFGPMATSLAIRWYGLSLADAEDVRQDVMLQLLLHADSIQNVRTWITGTTINVCRRVFRQRQKWLEHASTVEKEPVDPNTGKAFERLLAERVWAEVARLPAKDREMLTLLYREELSYAEVAQRLSLPIGSIGPTRARIICRLLDSLSTASATGH